MYVTKTEPVTVASAFQDEVHWGTTVGMPEKYRDP
jgi:hypothetical protein